MKVKVAMIDTEVHNHPILKNIVINNIWKSDECKKCWHGTAVCGEIYQVCQDIDVDVYPIFTDDEAETEKIIKVLYYIASSDKVYHVINMSLGVQESECVNQIENICKQIVNKGTILVAAFNNNGTMTYPACLDCVIGVDLSAKVSGGYIWIDGGTVNILGPLEQKNVLYDNKRRLVIGSSFLCGHITGLICKYIISINGKYHRNDIYRYLRENASEQKSYGKIADVECFEMSKAVLFPFSKELETVLNLRKYTKLDIIGVYDIKFSLSCGLEVETWDKKKYIVQNISKIEWDKFDTFVIGHIDKYINAGVGKYIEEIVKKSIIFNKKIYALDDEILTLYKEKYPQLGNIVYCPMISKKNFPHAQMGKMWNIPIPVIVVLGTRSQQGKFTTQIEMYSYFKEQGYSVGLLTSEPTGGLFEADYIFPYGYHKTVSVPLDEYAIYINNMAYKSYLKNRDIILFSMQASTLPKNYFNMNQCTTMQFSLLFGLAPDIVVLTVSPDDEIDLIRRTIMAVEAYSQAVVSAIMVNPVIIKVDENGRIKKVNLMISDEKKLDSFILELSSNINVSIYKMSEESSRSIVEDIIDILSE